MAVCVQSAILQPSYTHSALECVSPAATGLHVCKLCTHILSRRPGKHMDKTVYSAAMHNPYFEDQALFSIDLLCVSMSVLVGVRPGWCLVALGEDGTVCTYSAAFRFTCVLPLPHQQGQHECFHIFSLKPCSSGV